MHTHPPSTNPQRERRRSLPQPLVVLLTLALVVPLATAVSASPDLAPGRYVVGFDEMPDGLTAGQSFWGGTVLAVDTVLRFATVDLPDGPSSAMLADPQVRYVERDQPVELLFTPNDPKWGERGAYFPGMIGATTVWDQALGGDATVCVIDTGLRMSHEDLAPNYLGGIDLVDGDDEPWDAEGHGTGVSGAATAAVNNARGATGVANVGLLHVRLTSPGSPGGSLATAIRWCADQGADVVSMSLLTGETTASNDAIAYARSRGALLVAGAGNDGPCTDCVGYPARHADVVAVGCVKSYRVLCDAASQGAAVELAAPGYAILVPSLTDDTSYRLASGTSFAAPVAAGAAALLKAIFPAATADQLRDALAVTAEDLGDAGRDPSYGHGLVRVDLAYDHLAALLATQPPPPPGTPDLHIAALSTSPSAPVEGDLVSVTATVANQGTADAGAFTLRLLVDGAILSDVSIGSLASGATATVTRTWTATAGSHTAEASADIFSQVTESDEANNAASHAFSVSTPPPSGTPDLTITSLTVSPSTPVEGDLVSVTATVKNQGSADAGSFTLRFTMDGTSLSDVARSGLSAGAWTTITRSWTATAGSHTAGAHADVFGQVAESDEANNAASHAFTVDAPAPAPNEAPLASFTTACDARTCTLDASSSSDGDGSLVSYAWTFGDGSTGAGQVVTHTYAADGTYTVRLTVTDDDGATGTAQASVSVTGPVERTMRVASIDQGTKGPHLEMTARVVDDAGASLGGAYVSLETCISATCRTFSGTTDSAGVFSVRWDHAPSGSATTCATNVSKSAYTWDGDAACSTLDTSSGGGNGNGNKK